MADTLNYIKSNEMADTLNDHDTKTNPYLSSNLSFSGKGWVAGPANPKMQALPEWGGV